MQDVGRGAEGLRYGNMPFDRYLRKIEVSAVDENPDAYENYVRDLLTDFSCDTPAFESDEIRTSDDRGGGFHSAEKLNLRDGGARSSEFPDLPDGTFLDWEFTERDPRGVQNLPNMRDMVKQSEARASFINFYNDDDYSIPESGVNPVVMEEQRRAGFYQLKQNMKIYEESKDSWHNGGVFKVLKKPRPSNNVVQRDGVILDLTDASVRNRTDATGILSNDPTIAFRYSTPDHRFKTARYGMIRANQDPSYNNWGNTIRSTYLDHVSPVPINGIMVNRQLANLIVDLQGQRDTKQEIAKGAYFNDSYGNQVRDRKIAADDVIKMFLIDGSQPLSAQEENYNGKQIRREHQLLSDIDQRSILQSIKFNHHIADTIEQTNRFLQKRDKNTIKQAVIDSMAKYGLSTEMKNRESRGVNDDDKRYSELAKEGLTGQYIEDSKTIKTYAGIKPSKKNVVQKVDMEKYGGTSSGFIGRKKENLKEITNINNLDNDQEQLDGINDFGFLPKSLVRGFFGEGRNQQNAMDFGDMQRGMEFGTADLKNLQNI
jgi:hypothetical protein